MMDLFLLYQVALGVGLVIIGAWTFDARRWLGRVMRLIEMRYDPPTEELEIPPTMGIAPRLEEFGPSRPVPPFVDFDLWDRAAGQDVKRWVSGDDAA